MTFIKKIPHDVDSNCLPQQQQQQQLQQQQQQQINES